MLSEFQKHNKVLDLFEKKPILTQRSRLFYFIREYFYKNEFIEVDTPIVCASLAPEVGIEAPKLEGRSEFLRTSPELDMKQMLVAGFERIFLLGACFREGELSATHREEFTMLEWYQVNSDYADLIRFTVGMLRHISLGLNGSMLLEYGDCKIDLSLEPEIITVEEAFRLYADRELSEVLKSGEFEDLLMELVEPHLGLKRITFLIDYPVEMAALSRVKKENPLFAERWELYLGGIEIANAYSELTDLVEQKKRFSEAESQRSLEGAKKYETPYSFYNALEYGMPESAGCALGVDRLLMLFANLRHINEVKCL